LKGIAQGLDFPIVSSSEQRPSAIHSLIQARYNDQEHCHCCLTQPDRLVVSRCGHDLRFLRRPGRESAGPPAGRVLGQRHSGHRDRLAACRLRVARRHDHRRCRSNRLQPCTSTRWRSKVPTNRPSRSGPGGNPLALWAATRPHTGTPVPRRRYRWVWPCIPCSLADRQTQRMQQQ